MSSVLSRMPLEQTRTLLPLPAQLCWTSTTARFPSLPPSLTHPSLRSSLGHPSLSPLTRCVYHSRCWPLGQCWWMKMTGNCLSSPIGEFAPQSPARCPHRLLSSGTPPQTDRDQAAGVGMEVWCVRSLPFSPTTERYLHDQPLTDWFITCALRAWRRSAKVIGSSLPYCWSWNLRMGLSLLFPSDHASALPD